MDKPTLDSVTKKILELIIKKQHTEAFKLLVDNYNQRVYWHIRRIVQNHDDANDVLQNIYIKIWKSLPRFKGNSKIYTWIYRIATNESITFLNKKKKQPVSINSVYRKETFTNYQTELMDAENIQSQLEIAIATLPNKQRVVFNLKYFEELKYTEIATITDTSVGALKASYHIAVKKIEKKLKGN